MDLILSVVLIVIGLLLLIKSADFLVSGASSLAQKFKISPIVIGLTVVAFGTSAPEMVVSVGSALSGNTEIALGNIIGSNIANILLILGLASVVYPLKVNKNTVWKEIPMSFLAAIILTVLGLQTFIDNPTGTFSALLSSATAGSITRSNGIVLISFFLIFLYYTFGIAKATGDTEPEIAKQSMPKMFFLIAGGLLGLMLGSKMLVDSSVTLAGILGVSDTLIGLTVVAIGTSLPELVTSVVAALKKHADIAVGNVVGSNIFNIFLILGVTSIVKELPLPGIVIGDIIVLLGATLFLFAIMFVRAKHRISRFEGGVMLAAYVVYLGYITMRG